MFFLIKPNPFFDMKSLCIFLSVVFVSVKTFCASIIVPASADMVTQATSYYYSWNSTTVKIPLGASLLIYNNLFVNMNEGDTLLLDANVATGNNIYTRTPLLIKNISGSINNPIVVKNISSKIIQITQADNSSYYGFVFHGCSHIKVSGRDGSSAYNLRIKNFNNTTCMGVAFDRNTNNVELEYAEIAYVGAQAIQFKSAEPFNGTNNISDTAYCRQYIKRASLGIGKFHNNYIHNCGAEGLYIGSTNYDNGDGIAVTIDRDFATNIPTNNILFYSNNSWRFLPHFIDTILVYDNITDSTGWDGIQVAMAKYYKVYNNTVSNYGVKKEVNQMFGIIIGSPCIGETYNNTINTGSGSGIQCFGIYNRIYNNLIINANLNHKENIWWAINSIYFNDKSCTPQTLSRMGFHYIFETLFEAIHNTIIMNPNDSGRAIMFMQNYAGQTQGRCYNNLGVSDKYPLLLNTTNTILDHNIFIANPQQSGFSNSFNYVSTDIQTVGFNTTSNNIYSLRYGVAASRNANILTAASSDEIWRDKIGTSRVIDATKGSNIVYPSFGCYETTDTTVLRALKPSLQTKKIVLWPNPFDRLSDNNLSGEINLDYINTDKKVAIELIDLLGNVKTIEATYSNGKIHLLNINLSQENKGIYFARLRVDDKIIAIEKLILI